MESANSLRQYIMIGLTVAIIPLIIYLKFFTKNMRNTLKELAESLGWEFKGSIFSEAVAAGEYNGIAVKMRYWPGSKYRSSYFKIELDSAASFEIKISKENFMHRLGKTTGLAKEIETGDPQFDEKYFLRASDDYNAELFMHKTQVRQAVTYILDTGFNLNIDRQQIVLTANVMYSRLADVLMLKNVLDQAYRLIQELP